MSVDKIIMNKVNRIKRGVVFFTEDFRGESSLEAVRIAFHRLAKSGKVTRVANGIYVRPVISELIGKVMPSAEEVAVAIAKRDRAKIVPSGVLALNLLGLSTQVPLNAVYLTDGSPRNIKVGNRTIKFKRVSPKKLSSKGELSGMAILALQALGKENFDKEREEHLVKLLRKEDVSKLKHDIKLAPDWIARVLKKALEE